MEQITDLKAILHSKRANIYYLEKCRVMQKGGGGGTPLLVGNEIEWLSPQSEYRPTEYVQGWLSFWFDEAKRLQVESRLFWSRSLSHTFQLLSDLLKLFSIDVAWIVFSHPFKF